MGYAALSMEQVRKAVLDTIGTGKIRVGETMHYGISQSFLIAMLRDKGFRIVGNDYAFADMLRPLGFKVDKGFVGKHTRKGYAYCSPARCVYLPAVLQPHPWSNGTEVFDVDGNAFTVMDNVAYLQCGQSQYVLEGDMVNCFTTSNWRTF